MRWAALLPCLALATCQPRDPLAEKEFVPASCIPEALGPAPTGLETRETLLAEPDGPRRYTRLASDWAARVARMAETEPTIAACR